MRPGNFPPYSESHVSVSTFGWPGAGTSKRSVRVVYSTHPCANTGRATSSTNSGSIIERRGINFSFRGRENTARRSSPFVLVVHVVVYPKKKRVGGVVTVPASRRRRV